MVFHCFILSASRLPPHPLSLSLKRQSKAIITTSASAKPRLFWYDRDCGKPPLISLSLCRGTPIRPDSALCNEGLGIKVAMERSALLWPHCGWSLLFGSWVLAWWCRCIWAENVLFHCSLASPSSPLLGLTCSSWAVVFEGHAGCLSLWLNDTGNRFESPRALSLLLDS